MSSSPSDLPSLGSLAQAARGKALTKARRVLIVAGILLMIGAGIDLAMARTLVKQAVEQEVRNRQLVATPAELQQEQDRLMRIVYLFDGWQVFMGVLFVVFAFMIRHYPVPITILCLVIFGGWIAVLAVENPALLLAGWLIKLIVVVALIQALRAAFAYQREQNQSAELGPI